MAHFDQLSRSLSVWSGSSHCHILPHVWKWVRFENSRSEFGGSIPLNRGSNTAYMEWFKKNNCEGSSTLSENSVNLGSPTAYTICLLSGGQIGTAAGCCIQLNFSVCVVTIFAKYICLKLWCLVEICQKLDGIRQWNLYYSCLTQFGLLTSEKLWLIGGAWETGWGNLLNHQQLSRGLPDCADIWQAGALWAP